MLVRENCIKVRLCGRFLVSLQSEKVRVSIVRGHPCKQKNAQKSAKNRAIVH